MGTEHYRGHQDPKMALVLLPLQECRCVDIEVYIELNCIWIMTVGSTIFTPSYAKIMELFQNLGL
jgi:hypothetical protein